MRSTVGINVLILILTFAGIVYPNFYFGLSAVQKGTVVVATLLGCASAIWAGFKVKGTDRVVLGLVTVVDILHVVLLGSANIV